MTTKERMEVIGVVCVSTALLLFCAEITARLLTDWHILSYYQPLTLVQKHLDAKDTRMEEIFVVDAFAYDPTIFWKPKANVGPFNSLGFIGDLQEKDYALSISTSSCTFIAYGDSNTQGGPETSWSEELGKLFQKNQQPIRILNAGVMGYSSYQGVERFRRDVSTYKPSLIFVSFGWNDASPNMGVADKEFHTWMSSVLGSFHKSRLFQVIKYYSDQVVLFHFQKRSVTDSRVSLEDYRSNLLEFVRIAKENDVQVVLLTRVFNHSIFTEPVDIWRRQVLDYNDVVREVATVSGVPFIDLQSLFEKQYSFEEFGDDCHLETIGHIHAANIIMKELEKHKIQCDK